MRTSQFLRAALGSTIVLALNGAAQAADPGGAAGNGGGSQAAAATIQSITNDASSLMEPALAPSARDFATAKSKLPLVDSLRESIVYDAQQATSAEVVGENGAAPR